MKRVISLLLCIALVLCLCPTVHAADITFLAINDSIPIAPTADTAPFYANSLLYIPVSVFDIAALGIVPLYDSSSRVLTLFNDSRSLTFNLDERTMTNENGTIFTAQVISRSGTLFVPALYCAYHFGLGVSFLTSQGGYSVVRFTTGSQVYDDELFIEKANNLIEYRANQYFAAITPEEGTGSEAAPPQTTDTTPDPPAEEEPEPDEETQPAVLYLAFTNADSMPSALEALEVRQLRGSFFFTEEEIVTHVDLVLQLYAGGHTIGLIADGTEASANEALDEILKTKALCFLALSEGAVSIASGVTFFADSEQLSIEDAVLIENTPQLYVLDSAESAGAFAVFDQAGTLLPQLRETTQF